MLILPIKKLNGRDTLVIVIGPAGLERMKRADPAHVESTGKYSLVNPRVVVCYEEETPEFKKMVQSGSIGDLLKFLTRGFEFRPDLGDNDNPPVSVKDMN